MADPWSYSGFRLGPYPMSPQTPLPDIDPRQFYGFGSTLPAGSFGELVSPPPPRAQGPVQGPAQDQQYDLGRLWEALQVLQNQNMARAAERLMRSNDRQQLPNPKGQQMSAAPSEEKWWPMALEPRVSPHFYDPSKPGARGASSPDAGKNSKKDVPYPGAGQLGVHPFFELKSPDHFLGPGTSSNFGLGLLYNGDPIGLAARVYSSANRTQTGTEYTKPTIGLGARRRGAWEAGIEGDLEKRAIKGRLTFPIGRVRPGS